MVDFYADEEHYIGPLNFHVDQATWGIAAI